MANCTNCDDLGWVCEAHTDQPWREARAEMRGCDCGPGQPCHICNPCDRNNPPRMIPGFVEGDVDDDGSPEARDED